MKLNPILLENYHKSLNQKYTAVCLDIDGTLTKDNSKEIDQRIICKLVELLKRKIPIVFITGRGETGLKDFVNDIIPTMINKYNMDTEQLSKLYVLINDGARLYKTSTSSNILFDMSEYLISKTSLEQLNALNQILINSKDYICGNNSLITYSYDSANNQIFNIRIKINDYNQRYQSRKIINEIIKSNNLNDLNITEGIYEGNYILQIGTTIKKTAIEQVEKIIGIPQNSMLRIGDCGNENGNDYTLLNCSQGFSVYKTSKSNDKCFPIIKNDNQILTGTDATIELLNQAKLLPTICLESAIEQDYRKKYANIERMINIGKKEQLNKYDNLINCIYDSYDGINDLYDPNTGSIIIPMYDFELIEEENPLKKLWNKKDDENLQYSLRDDNNYLLRGSKTYYYFLANRQNDESTSQEILTKQMVLQWMDNYIDFFALAIHAVNEIQDLSNIQNKKLILGILDNIRNVNLICINQIINYNYGDKNLLINLEKINKNELLSKYYQNILITDEMMKNLSFNKNYLLNKNELLITLINVLQLLKYHRSIITTKSDTKDYSKEFRVYREIDNFAENYITMDLANKKINDSMKYGICGLSYGGIELPIIQKILNKNNHNIGILRFCKDIASYKNKHSVEIRNFDINDYGGVQNFGMDLSLKYIIADDNLLTAKTMQLALNTFYDIKVDVNSIITVRYPSINRVNQMFMENHGAVDYKYLFNFIYGLCFQSPYTWRDENNDDMYKDSLGVFDKNRQKILECLYKNHDYRPNSEVAKIKKLTLY